MNPTPTILITALSIGAQANPDMTNEGRSSSKPRKDNVAIVGRMLTGFDSNVDQRAGGIASSSVVQVSGEANYARMFSNNFVASGNLELWSDFWSADAFPARFGLESAFEVSSYVVGSGQYRGLGRPGSIFPRVRLRLIAGYDFDLGLSRPARPGPGEPVEPPDPTDPPDPFDPTDPEVDDDILDGTVLDDDQIEDSDRLGRPAIALRNPFHRWSAEIEARYEPWDRTDFELSYRVLRAMLDGEIGEAARDFTQWDIGLLVAQDIFRRFSVGGGYRFAFRDHDERTASSGDPLQYQTHETEAFVRYQHQPWSVRLVHRFRYRLANTSGRNRIRNTLELQTSWQFYGPLFAVAELAVAWEDRISRPERDWQRYETIAGLQFQY